MVTVAEAIAAASGPSRYVRIAGRIDAEDEFEDDAHRPLVLRRTRLEVRDGRDWRVIDERRESVAFEVREGLDGIAIDDDALDTGLVVIPRESVGTAADVPDRVPAETPADDPGPASGRPGLLGRARHRPRRPDDSTRTGRPQMTAGLGRPLILTTLEPDEAMRVLAGSGSRRPLAAAISLGAALVLLTRRARLGAARRRAVRAPLRAALAVAHGMGPGGRRERCRRRGDPDAGGRR